ncbi:alpha-glucosidase [Tamaricihabitans halophyticus]|uniref:Alpha-glucosidase n=1 Tax=Tamaricihabitans halophyticus TaxID=1262583 RepID=A0A4R2QIN5_9PSEU|nr:glycoside hydrolase family 13 protein [Tamaricihabitans halophyticus]TCP48544.1 alpha-glucosidase [Tamaricihabitans halophyticus]
MRRSAGIRQSATDEDVWWRNCVFYQVYVPSFADSTGDGIGDLRGIRARLGYLELLGVDALWLTPFYPSPMADNGYDVADPRAVDDRFGTLDDFDALVAEAHRYGLKVTIDLVPNHTSSAHHWFQEALQAPPHSAERERYLFRDGRGPNGTEPPNNWTSVFGGPAWTRVADGQWYLHLFDTEQPDLNWANPEVQDDLQQTMRFWLDRGVDGFRIDVAHAMAKPPDLPDMEPAAGDSGALVVPGVYDPRFDNDSVHDIHRMARKVLDSYPGRMAVGELWILDDERFAKYLRADELQLGFNFRLLTTDFDANRIREAIEHSLDAVRGPGAQPTWTLANHDVGRQVSRYGDGWRGLARARAMALVMLALPGVAFLYNGEELGLPDVHLPDEALRDPVWERSGHVDRGRDGCRVPLPWEGEQAPFGFSTGTRSWLPVPEDWAGLTVETQLEDADSVLSLYRRALELRRERPEFSGEELEWYGAPPGCFAFRRKGGGLICALNTSAAPVPLPPGEILLSSGPIDSADTSGGGELPGETAAWLIPAAED